MRMVVARLTTRLMELDHIPVRVADEYKLCATRYGQWAAGQRYAQLTQVLLNGIEIGYLQGNMRISGMFFRNIHQDIVGSRPIPVKNEIDIHAGGMLHDRDRLRPHRAHNEFESKLFVE